mmetsp:Transcript_9274/g.19583  ORF Transcript_9274/g.19583 Transcript_9274/m.19583 type:complete len:90 (+) Transcript_9274:2180-2449(+)
MDFEMGADLGPSASPGSETAGPSGSPGAETGRPGGATRRRGSSGAPQGGWPGERKSDRSRVHAVAGLVPCSDDLDEDVFKSALTKRAKS